MARPVQIVFDCRDPEGLSKFYAAALDYRLQDPPEGFSSWEEALRAWDVPEEEWNAASAIVDPEGHGPRIYFQQMDTPKPGKNRVHLDVTVSGGAEVPLEERRARSTGRWSVSAGWGRGSSVPGRNGAPIGSSWRTRRTTSSACSRPSGPRWPVPSRGGQLSTNSRLQSGRRAAR